MTIRTSAAQRSEESGSATTRRSRIRKRGFVTEESSRQVRSDVGLVDVAPAPILARLEGLDDRMALGAKMGAGGLVLGRIAAADVAADQAEPQVDPPIADSKTVLAALGAGDHFADLGHVRTGFSHRGSSNPESKIENPSSGTSTSPNR